MLSLWDRRDSRFMIMISLKNNKSKSSSGRVLRVPEHGPNLSTLGLSGLPKDRGQKVGELSAEGQDHQPPFLSKTRAIFNHFPKRLLSSPCNSVTLFTTLQLSSASDNIPLKPACNCTTACLSATSMPCTCNVIPFTMCFHLPSPVWTAKTFHQRECESVLPYKP